MYPRTSVMTMSAPVGPYRRAVGTKTVPMHFHLTPDVREKIVAYARSAGVPQWTIIEAAINAGEPDETGVPVGWDLPGHEDTLLPGLNDGGGAVRNSP